MFGIHRELLTELSSRDIFNSVFHGKFYPWIYFLQCLFTCYFLRRNTQRGGLKVYRSFILGFTLTYTPRFLVGLLVSRRLPEISDGSFFYPYVLAWVLLNIFSFDLVFILLNNGFSRLILVLLSGYAEAILLVYCLYVNVSVFEDKYSRILLNIAIAYLSPMLVHYLDGKLFQQQRKTMLHPVHYVKRVLVISVIVLALTQKNQFVKKAPYLSMYDIIPYVVALNCFLRFLDFALHRGDPFMMLDFVLPKFVVKYFAPHYLKDDN